MSESKSVGTSRSRAGLERGFRLVAGAALLGLFGACTDATDVELLEVRATGAVAGQVYMDLTGDARLGPGDELLQAVTIRLRAAGNAAEVAQTVSGGDGRFLFDQVPVGRYTVHVDDALLGDTLTTATLQAPVDVVIGDTLDALVGVSFPHLTLDQVRTAAPGRRVFTAGVALNARPGFGEGRVFLQGATRYLQATEVGRTPAISVGDSVRLLGRTAQLNGHPTLDQATPIILVGQATVPTPRTTTTARAASADGGAWDAALVRIQTAEISDTITVEQGEFDQEEFRVTVDDGSGPIELVLRGFLGFNTSLVRPDTTVRVANAVGMLAPFDDGSGAIRWRLLVRSPNPADWGLETRLANAGVTATFSPTTAALGDQIQLRVVVTNSGPLAATGVEVADTLPAVLTRGASTASAGSYTHSGIGGVWSIDRLEPGASDTLTVMVDVTGATLGSATYVAHVGGLDREVDPADGNNRATTTVILLAP